MFVFRIFLVDFFELTRECEGGWDEGMVVVWSENTKKMEEIDGVVM